MTYSCHLWCNLKMPWGWMPICTLFWFCSKFITVCQHMPLVVSLVFTTCHYLSMSVTFCHCLSLSVTVCHFLSLSVTFCHCLSPYVTVCHYLPLYVTVCQCPLLSVTVFWNLLGFLTTVYLYLHVNISDSSSVGEESKAIVFVIWC